MRKPALFKFSGVSQRQLTLLLAFIDSDKNHPKRLTGEPDEKMQYITLLDQSIADGEKDKSNPTYHVSLQIQLGRNLAHAQIGRWDGPTPRQIPNRVFELLEVFPVGRE